MAVNNKNVLKRSLFIGLGGTGAHAIMHTKKRFIDAYGQLPPMVGFLVIDTDNDTQNLKIDDKNNESVRLEGSEFVYSQVKDARVPYQMNKDTIFKWFPEEVIATLNNITAGAGQIRANGRFSLFFNHDRVFHAIQKKLNEILSAAVIDHPDFEANGEDVEINLVFSLGGGTGSGTFIDVAYLVREAIKSYPNPMKSLGFIVKPDVFRVMGSGPMVQNVRPNGYGALHDLDYLMHMTPNSTPLHITYENRSITIDQPPFDVVFSINNKNNAGHVYHNVKELSELIGLAMFTGASELSGSAKSSYDNVESVLALKHLDVENKKAWACGMGLGELFYDGQKLSEIYISKAVKALVQKLVTHTEEVSHQVDNFIDAPRVQIRENDGDKNNFLIDSLLSPNPKFPLAHINDNQNASVEVDQYLQQEARMVTQTIEENYHSKLKEVTQELEKFIAKHINGLGGVGKVIEILNQLKNQILLFNKEMKTEEKQLLEASSAVEHQLQQVHAELKEVASGFGLFKKQKVNDTKSDLFDAVHQVASNKREIARRQWAIKFFNELSGEVDTHLNNGILLKQNLEKVGEQAINQAHRLQIQADDNNKSFIIELHKEELNNISVDVSQLNIEAFINNLSAGGLLELEGASDKLIAKSLYKHCKNLGRVKFYQDRKIDEVLNDMSEQELMNTMKQLVAKSAPLWSYNFHGYTTSKELAESFVVGVPDEAQSRIVKSNILSKVLPSNVRYQFNSTKMNNRVVIYRMEAAVPPYAVNDVKGYRRDYESSEISHHIDKDWLMRMKREDFDLFPQRKQDENLMLWVMSFIHKAIKYEEGKYKVYSPKAGDALKSYWLDLSDYRDEAFTEFKRLGLASEMTNIIDRKIKEMGSQRAQELIKEAIKGSNYLEKFSQNNLSLLELDQRENKPIRELLSEEIDYVTKKLAPTLN